MMEIINDEYQKREHWIVSTDYYKQPYMRLEKCAKIVNSIAQGRECDLLDVGCGPATLAKLLHKDIHYYGIDIAIHTPAPNLIELDVTQNEIKFEDKRFDIIVAAGLFEYLGKFQRQKLAEILNLLNENGTFITTYTNFNHIHPPLQEPTYNNMVSISEFKSDLELFFNVKRYFPSSHNWIRREPSRSWLQKINMQVNFEIPIISPRFANNYFFICTKK